MSTSPGSKPIVGRTVKRYFYNGKGYATKRKAYETKARKILVEMVLGPWIEVVTAADDYGNEWSWWTLEKLQDAPVENRKQWIDAQFAKFFPHGWVEGCIHAGCEQDMSAQGCAITGQEYDGHRLVAFDYVYQSCKWSQDMWIKQKAQELMAEDANAS